jgi:hypothetical protein
MLIRIRWFVNKDKLAVNKDKLDLAFNSVNLRELNL